MLVEPLLRVWWRHACFIFLFFIQTGARLKPELEWLDSFISRALIPADDSIVIPDALDLVLFQESLKAWLGVFDHFLAQNRATGYQIYIIPSITLTFFPLLTSYLLIYHDFPYLFWYLDRIHGVPLDENHPEIEVIFGQIRWYEGLLLLLCHSFGHDKDLRVAHSHHSN